ncbi:UDP-N-acetylmuramate dehydrogenase [Herbaspirillum sp. RTI4]|uniref:UDP-N-acetylmuramate dehydrogenase n=1 Tax=Herbaspirillum sp. RTI4 TaxID=3048640 RepID=UPI002AB4A873|nr:UDP-N-acetylmuramate dehydrogenase [Herbaspirillum sp. RTI4]MDY7578183.1 UDP-N-acetylmuramate dehydrogenase [Herbaspirillum sp. RTI4]MEA9981521.1 UDP-N-acetylmuramate dehydrogenase [Herbaspirillum sp. RTI4]
MLPIPLQRDFSLRNFNTFGVDARALAYLEVTDADILAAVRRDSALSALPRLVLGGGSNLLLTRDFPGLVLHMRNRGIAIAGEDADYVYVRAAAGESWHGLVEWTLAQGLGGLENLALIPGSVGAAPIQNIGAYGVELKDRFHQALAYDFLTGERMTLDTLACAFAYRDSVFKQTLRNRAVVLEVTLALPRRWQANCRYADVAQALEASGITDPTPREIADAVIAIRRRKLPDPAVTGNAGSFFKNPLVSAQRYQELALLWPQLTGYVQPDGSYKLAAGWLIDQCGWKGRQLGAAGVYEKQALVLVNRGGASGQEIAELAKAIQADVEARFGVRLEPEPVYI